VILGSPVASLLLVAMLLASCAVRDAGAPPAGSAASSSPAISGRASSSQDLIEEVLTSFPGFPPLRGTQVIHTDEGDLTFRVWIREPAVRVEPVGGVLGPWIVDGRTSNISEPHLHIVTLLNADPREMLLLCGHPSLAGTDERLG
jgi:hypothetical protein